MSWTTDDVTEGPDQTTYPSPEAQGPDGAPEASRETEASFEEIER